MAILLFLSIITSIGLVAYGIGAIVLGLTQILPISDFLQVILQIVIMASIYYVYTKTIIKIVLNLYKSMKMQVKILTKKEFILMQSVLIGLMFVHSFTLNFVLTKMYFSLQFIAVITITSFVLGITIKNILDNSYQIKLTEQGDRLIFEDN